LTLSMTGFAGDLEIDLGCRPLGKVDALIRLP
jgi:hypothetical protein